MMTEEIDKNLIIIRVAGGICSQILYLGLGWYFKNRGFEVKYDLTYFKEWGKSIYGDFPRNFDILKAFPNIEYQIATKSEIDYYKKNYNYVFEKSVSGCVPPAYVFGWPKERKVSDDLREYLINNFNPIDKEDITDIYEEILSSKSCGVHVRRGDLTEYNPSYGYPTPVEYYLKALKIINGLSDNIKFYFFSDECDWIKEKIIPNLDFKIDYKICDKNGSDKGYLDLYLMTKCDYLISSSGSLARFAKKLSKKNPPIIMDRYDHSVADYYNNVLILLALKELNKSI